MHHCRLAYVAARFLFRGALHLAGFVSILDGIGKAVAAFFTFESDHVERTRAIPIMVRHKKGLVTGRLEVAGAARLAVSVRVVNGNYSGAQTCQYTEPIEQCALVHRGILVLF